MTSAPSAYETATMARVFARQGYLRKAARIYRRLLDQAPQQGDLEAELAEVQRRIAAQKRPSCGELGLLIREWAGLIRQQKTRR